MLLIVRFSTPSGSQAPRSLWNPCCETISGTARGLFCGPAKGAGDRCGSKVAERGLLAARLPPRRRAPARGGDPGSTFFPITRQAIRRDSFTSVKDLVAAVENFIDGWEDRCQPLTWSKSVREPGSHDITSPI